jgi:hypothetical protein
MFGIRIFCKKKYVLIKILFKHLTSKKTFIYYFKSDSQDKDAFLKKKKLIFVYV